MTHCQHLLSVKLSLTDLMLNAGCLKQGRWNPEAGTQRIIPCSSEGFHPGLSLDSLTLFWFQGGSLIPWLCALLVVLRCIHVHTWSVFSLCCMAKAGAEPSFPNNGKRGLQSLKIKCYMQPLALESINMERSPWKTFV